LRDFKLYVILNIECGNTVEIAQKVISAGADIIQLRAKGSCDREVIELAENLKKLVRKTSTSFVLNDRADLAKIVEADGVHLGQTDLSVKDGRKILDTDKFIGISTHSLDQALAAQREGADYIGIGPIFATATKPNTSPLKPKIIAKIKPKIKLPFVAIGGITLDNLDQVLACGAKRIAVSQAIIGAKDVYQATKQFRQRLYN